MISEIVRSKTNIDNGARTRFANMFHGLFLLVFVALSPALVNQLPQAALGAMLVFTGFLRGKFVHMYRLGEDQCLIFVSTIVVRDAVIFSTWIPLRKHLHHLLQAGKRAALNLSETRLVDHTVMCKLQEWKTEFAEQDSELSVTGLERHRPLSDSPVAVHTRPGT